MKLSIIIPTLNEEAVIGDLLAYLCSHTSPVTEVILADGGSTDRTCAIGVEQGARVLHCTCKGRAPQLNAGAAAATGQVLYFLHADTYPPPNFEVQLQQAVQQGIASAAYRLRFDLPHWFLRLNAWFTRFDVDALRFGDQSLMVLREVFTKAGGYNECMRLLEDQEIIGRLRRYGRFAVLPWRVTTSARKYKELGVYRLQGGYFLIYSLYRLGASQERLLQVYRRLLRC